jgi:hypothetical protein
VEKSRPVISYDEEGDRLYVSIGEPRAAVNVGIEKGICGRITPAGEFIGLEILNPQGRFGQPPSVFTTEEFVQPLLDRYKDAALKRFSQTPAPASRA